MINRRGQEAGQAISSLVAFFIILVLLVVFYWISSAAALFARGADASTLEFYSGNVGNADLISVPKTDDPFLNRPVLVQFADGDIQLVSVNVLAALYRSDTEEIDRLRKERDQAQQDYRFSETQRELLINQWNLAYAHSVTSEIFGKSLKDLIAKHSEKNTCLIFGQSSSNKLENRIGSAGESSFGDDFFFKFDGTDVKRIPSSIVQLYYLKNNILSEYVYSSSKGEKVTVEYYYGPCLGDSR